MRMIGDDGEVRNRMRMIGSVEEEGEDEVVKKDSRIRMIGSGDRGRKRIG